MVAILILAAIFLLWSSPWLLDKGEDWSVKPTRAERQHYKQAYQQMDQLLEEAERRIINRMRGGF